MSSHLEVLLSIGVVALFPLTVALLFVAARGKEQLTSDKALERLKENWPKLRMASVLGSIALFIFLWTELMEVLETVFNLQFDFLSHIIPGEETYEVMIIYLLILAVAINFYLVLKISGGVKSERA
ncbi:MAG: hypothetical protein V3R82_05695 [Candidatus Hydrothermarchaeales archaeon]